MAELLEDPSGMTDIHLLLSFVVLATAAGILMIVGILCGIWPAFRAARMDPIESLRSE